METVQKRFMETLDKRAADKGLELVISYNYSNCGDLHLMAPDSFDTALTIPFMFSSEKTSFGWMFKDAKDARPVFFDRPNPYFAGFEAGELDAAIEAMLEAAEHSRQREP